MRALSNQCIELLDGPGGQYFRSQGKQDISVIVPSLVGDDCQNARAGRDAQERLIQNVAQFSRRKIRAGRTFADKCARWLAGSSFQGLPRGLSRFS
jgi:hypothetical protein